MQKGKGERQKKEERRGPARTRTTRKELPRNLVGTGTIPVHTGITSTCRYTGTGTVTTIFTVHPREGYIMFLLGVEDSFL